MRLGGVRLIIALAAKEIRVAMMSPILYVVAGVFLAIVGLFFSQIVTVASLQSVQMLRFQGALPQLNLTVLVFHPIFRNIHVILLLVIPLLTMRLLSEERKHKTVELLMTSPLTLTQIVAGKYLAALAIFAGLLALTGYMPILLAAWGAVDWPTVLSGYLGLLLVGGGVPGDRPPRVLVDRKPDQRRHRHAGPHPRILGDRLGGDDRREHGRATRVGTSLDQPTPRSLPQGAARFRERRLHAQRDGVRSVPHAPGARLGTVAVSRRAMGAMDG